ncbi:hypothetical protein F5146DRAFT_1122137 [Armillaria mellea]|nr:hypothetical protein F5146DRAFT_1122137 [Armillaria mellea]
MSLTECRSWGKPQYDEAGIERSWLSLKTKKVAETHVEYGGICLGRRRAPVTYKIDTTLYLAELQVYKFVSLRANTSSHARQRAGDQGDGLDEILLKDVMSFEVYMMNPTVYGTIPPTLYTSRHKPGDEWVFLANSRHLEMYEEERRRHQDYTETNWCRAALLILDLDYERASMGIEPEDVLSSREAPCQLALCLAARDWRKLDSVIYLNMVNSSTPPYLIPSMCPVDHPRAVVVPWYKSVFAANIELSLKAQGSNGRRAGSQVTENLDSGYVLFGERMDPRSPPRSSRPKNIVVTIVGKDKFHVYCKQPKATDSRFQLIATKIKATQSRQKIYDERLGIKSR